MSCFFLARSKIGRRWINKHVLLIYPKSGDVVHFPRIGAVCSVTVCTWERDQNFTSRALCSLLLCITTARARVAMLCSHVEQRMRCVWKPVRSCFSARALMWVLYFLAALFYGPPLLEKGFKEATCRSCALTPLIRTGFFPRLRRRVKSTWSRLIFCRIAHPKQLLCLNYKKSKSN